MNRTRITVAATATLCLLVLTAGIIAAGRAEGDPVSSPETSATTRPITSVPSTPASAPSAPVATTTPPSEVVAAGGCPAVEPRAEPDPDRPRYRVTVEADPVDGRVTGTLLVTFTPDLATDRLVFRLWPNGPRPASAGARLRVDAVELDGRSAQTETPDPTTLVVAGGSRFEPGDSVEVTMRYDLDIPGSVKDRISHSGDTLRLGSFLPLLAWQPGIGWATEPPTSGFAEAATSPTAAWDVSVAVPDGYQALASAPPGGDGHLRVEAARDFGLSVGRFATASTTVDLPRPVEVIVGVHAGIGEDPQLYLDRVVASLREFSTRYGAYPWSSYTLAITPGLSGGIEFPGHVMQGPGSQGRTTPHEVAHQWFYGLVGNNQAVAPWLDEGLATYAEARLENTLTSMQQREIPSDGKGRAGAPMTFWEDRQPSYYRSVYVQTTAALAALAPPDAIDCALSHYVAEYAHQIVEPEDAVAHLERFFPTARDTLSQFGLPTP